MASINKSGAKFVHELLLLKGKQLVTAFEIPVICLSPLDVSSIESPNVDSTKEAMEVLDQNLSPPKINKIWAYESKRKFQVSCSAKLLWVEL
jgi:hypothetical protein